MGDREYDMYPDSVSICKVINHLLAVLNGRGHNVTDEDNEEWKLRDIIYDKESDELYFRCVEKGCDV